MTLACRNVLRPITQGDAARNMANAGLLLTRYLTHAYANSDEFRDARLQLHRVARSASGNAVTVYRAAWQRWKQSLPEPCRTQPFSVGGRLLIGLGGENVLETGLTLHHVYGVPYLPGTALKGLASHYCHSVWGTADNSEGFLRGGDHHRVLFGDQDEGGLIHFHDAWIDPDSLEIIDAGLLSDVLTPHHGDYYGGNKKAPTDFDDPNPVAMLSVRGTFLVAVSTGCSESSDAWLDLSLELLKRALADWGVGGKTSSGYGRMHPVIGVARPSQTPAAVPLPSPRDMVEAELIEISEKRGKKKIRAKHLDTGIAGPIQNVADMPEDVAIGQRFRLLVAYANPREIAFKFTKQ